MQTFGPVIYEDSDNIIYYLNYILWWRNHSETTSDLKFVDKLEKKTPRIDILQN